MWTRRRVIIALASLLVGLALTLLGIRLVWSDFGLVGMILAPVWAATLVAGAYLFPEPMGELGHPIAWVIGVALNAAFLGIVLIAGLVVTTAQLERSR